MYFFDDLQRQHKRLWSPKCQGLNTNFGIYQLCDLGPKALPLWASFFIWKMVMPIVSTLKGPCVMCYYIGT